MPESQPPPVERKKPLPPAAEEMLGEFATKLALIKEYENLATQLAAEAREAGATWKQIGEAAGITPQGAHERWSDKGRKARRQAQAGAQDSEQA